MCHLALSLAPKLGTLIRPHQRLSHWRMGDMGGLISSLLIAYCGDLAFVSQLFLVTIAASLC